MAGNDVEILKDRMGRVPDAIRREGIKALRDGADYLLKTAKRKIVGYDAVDTGNMLNSGYVRTKDYDGWPSTTLFPGMRLPAPKDETEVWVNFAASYSRWVHDGTGSTQGRPFLTDAAETCVPYIKRRFSDAIRRGAEG